MLALSIQETAALGYFLADAGRVLIDEVDRNPELLRDDFSFAAIQELLLEGPQRNQVLLVLELHLLQHAREDRPLVVSVPDVLVAPGWKLSVLRQLLAGPVPLVAAAVVLESVHSDGIEIGTETAAGGIVAVSCHRADELQKNFLDDLFDVGIAQSPHRR